MNIYDGAKWTRGEGRAGFPDAVWYSIRQFINN